MINIKKEIKNIICDVLSDELDPYLVSFNFLRNKNALVYKRKINNAKQNIDIHLEWSPRDQPGARVCIYPSIRIFIPEVNSKAFEMCADNDNLLTNAPEITLGQPLAFTSQKKHTGRWFIYGPDSVQEVIFDLKYFLDCWGLSFLDEYCTAQSMVNGYKTNDARIIKTRRQLIYISAAMLVDNKPKDALDLFEKHFGNP